ncbi:uncharacterized protein CANTADRAFT_250060 [Suhomyces tanzawaensis NRRL Y-17324]|uniref:Uncharacterized protein n=1 Tax=Suhomyces tanzawaensis NRRL Y-17324 TaxID=984487 RepID=A0A1E4SI61_9ASCO|nr:uncharacterized protein CANTADRAFT_250060 [Suhomyces tanzawaensis NRRL Y-17324]ODV79204.1 hypothetical protein CANTADRAFT_250060 [Suhomyces tanzawaensis NRRL Y-17324]
MRFVYILTWLCTLAVGAAVPLIDMNTTDASSTYTSHEGYQAKRFASLTDLFKSLFWEKVSRKKDPQVAQRTVILIDDTNSTYFFGDSEMTDSTSSWWRPRQVEMTEVQFGEPTDLHIQDAPVSHCVSSEYSSAGGSYTHTYTWSQTDNHIWAHVMDGSLWLFGLRVSADLPQWAGNTDTATSITCPIQPGRTVQVLGTLNYKVYPRARKRRLFFGMSIRKYIDNWENVKDKNYGDLSHVYLLTDQTLNYYCTDRKEKLRCDEGPGGEAWHQWDSRGYQVAVAPAEPEVGGT